MTQTNNSQPWTLTLANVLSGPEPLDMVAGAQDIPNVRLEAKRGIWYGHLGDHADQSTVTPLTMTYVSIGATIKVSGVPYSWGGAMVGWRRVDGVLYSAVDPFSVVNAASTSPVDFVVATIPGGTFGDGDILEVFFPSETGASNVGSDTFGIVIGSTVIDGALAASALLTQAQFGVTKNGTTTRKIIAAATNGLRTNLFSTTAIDWSIDQIIKVRVTPATTGNSSYVRHIIARLTKC